MFFVEDEWLALLVPRAVLTSAVAPMSARQICVLLAVALAMATGQESAAVPSWLRITNSMVTLLSPSSLVRSQDARDAALSINSAAVISLAAARRSSPPSVSAHAASVLAQAHSSSSPSSVSAHPAASVLAHALERGTQVCELPPIEARSGLVTGTRPEADDGVSSDGERSDGEAKRAGMCAGSIVFFGADTSDDNECVNAGCAVWFNLDPAGAGDDDFAYEAAAMATATRSAMAAYGRADGTPSLVAPCELLIFNLRSEALPSITDQVAAAVHRVSAARGSGSRQMGMA